MADTTYVTFAVRAKDEHHPAVQKLLEYCVDERYIEDGLLTLCCYELNYAGHTEALDLISAGVAFVRYNEAGSSYGEGLMVHLGKEQVYECATLDHEPITPIRALKDGCIQLPQLAQGLKADAAREQFYKLCKEDADGDNED